ncbi:AraC family transcriptional regulator [Parabacteroides pacaensis]|uniref:AraC family transcriptional regulator n=1 Tax=Parabacteroides pacaensis TaxID=2086575 RepID=UPI000D11096D|nr:AraC family transcriptional regulator [Parabacteroides pacaensis]
METDINIKYLIANKQDKLWGMTVTTVGYQRIEPHSVYPPQNHPSEYLFSPYKGRTLEEYVLLYIVNGNGIFSSDTHKNVRLTTGSMLLLFPGEWHNYAPDPSSGWDEYWIGFQGNNVEALVQNGFFSKQKTVFNVGPSLEMVQLFRLAIRVAAKQKSGYQQTLAGIANLLLGMTHSLDKSQAFNQSQHIQLINKAKLIMFENSHTNITAEEVANRICMSYSNFRRNFKQYTGLSPHQYLQEIRIQKSKELLAATNLTCQEIAYKTGYESPIHFNTLFKKKTGLTPSKYREYYQRQESHSINRPISPEE